MRALGTAGAVAGALALPVAAVWAMQRRLIYVPERGSPGRAPAGAADVVLRTEDGLALGAWSFPPTAVPRGVGVLVAHGNGGDRGDRVLLAQALAAEGLSVLLFDYRGYGGNPGRPSEAGLARDARAARAWLLGEGGCAPDRLLYLGESLGTGVVASLAAAHPPGGLLLRSPFVDLAATGRVHYPYLPVRLLLRDRYPVAADAARARVPTVVVYGDADRIVPPAQSLAVAEAVAAAPGAREVEVVAVRGADHNDRALLDGPEIRAAAARLADLALARG